MQGSIEVAQSEAETVIFETGRQLKATGTHDRDDIAAQQQPRRIVYGGGLRNGLRFLESGHSVCGVFFPSIAGFVVETSGRETGLHAANELADSTLGE